MKRIVATLLAVPLATAAHAQSGLLPANQVWAGPPSGGQGYARARALVAADLPAPSFASFALTSGQIVVGQVSGFAGAVAMSGDCTIIASGAITCTKTGGVAFGALATVTPGTGVAAAAAVNVGSAGAVVVNGGALGTPSSGVGTNLTALNASNLASGTVAAARGGAGTITGALKGNGSGVVSQAACADISNATATCSAAAGQIPGTATNDNAATGNLGEYLESVVTNGSAITLTTATAANITNLSLTAGDWDCGGTATFTGNTTTATTDMIAWVSTASATLPADGINHGAYSRMFANTGLSWTQVVVNMPITAFRVSIASTTSVFLSVRSSFTTAAETASGALRCRRAR